MIFAAHFTSYLVYPDLTYAEFSGATCRGRPGLYTLAGSGFQGGMSTNNLVLPSVISHTPRSGTRIGRFDVTSRSSADNHDYPHGGHSLVGDREET